MELNRSILFLAMSLFASQAGAAVANLTACNQMLAQLTLPLIETSTRAPAVSEFIRSTKEKRRELEIKKAATEAEIAKFEEMVTEDRKTLKGLDWALDRSIKYPSVEAVPWAKQLKILRKHLRELERDLHEIVNTYEPQLFGLISTNSGTKVHYVKRLVDYLNAYAYSIEDVNWVLDSLNLMAEEFAVIEAVLPSNANGLTRSQHALKVRLSRYRVNKLMKTRLNSIAHIGRVSKDLAPFSGLDKLGLPDQISSSVDLQRWIEAFENARSTLKTQYENVFAKYDLMKSLAERAAAK